MEQFWKDEHFSIRWEEIPESMRWKGEWEEFRRLRRNNSLRYVILWHHKTEDGGIGNIDLPAHLRYLELNWSNAKTIGSLPAGVRRLETHYCTKLESVCGLAENCPGLRHLHVNQSKKLLDLPTITQLKKLEVLCLNTCGDLPNLKFLNAFPQLRDFRFVNTNVVDGDLSPLLSHLRLESVGTLDKRHYSHKAADITMALASRAKPADRRRSR